MLNSSGKPPGGAQFAVVLSLLMLIGVFLRLPPFLFLPECALHALRPLHPQPGFNGIGFDENLYRQYVSALAQIGLTSYPEMAEKYVEVQGNLPGAVLPPTRFIYIATACAWHEVTGADALNSLKSVSSLFSIMTLFLTAVFATALAGRRIGIAVTALMAFAPAQIHMSQHALIDGVFAFFALLCLWLLWQNLQRPDDWRWVSAYAIALALLVMTKENAVFAYLGLLGALASTWLFQFGRISRSLLTATVVGPFLGVTALIALCGSLTTTLHIYQLLVNKAAVLPYAVKTGDGPWYRYLVDLLLISPLVFIFALGAIFTIKRSETSSIFLIAFVVASFLLMCNVRYGMNLRYANMWDFPLNFLAASYLAALFQRTRYAYLWFAFTISVICLLELRQYQVLFVRFGLYELVPEGLLRALQILK